MKIALCTIVKNEEKVITRMLDSVKDVVDAVYIGDTGSEDETIPKVVNWLKENGIPGRIAAIPWKGFAESRNTALELVPERYDYILVLDADEVLEKGHELFAKIKAEPEIALHKDCYGIYLTDNSQLILAPRLYKPHIRFEGEIHNQPTGFKTMGSFSHTDMLIDHIHDGARAFDPDKLAKDTIQLRDMYERTGERNYGFYLGMTYLARNLFVHANNIFTEISDIKIKDEITFISFMKRGWIKYKQKDYFTAFLNFLDAHAVRPACEPLYYLMRIARLQGRYDLALRLGNRVDFSVLTSYIDPEVRAYEYEMEVLRSFVHVNTDKAKEAAEKLSDRSLPGEVRQELEKMIAEL